MVNLLQKLSPNLRKIIVNIGWLTIERILSMIVSLFVGIYVIRYLGADDFGKLSYSISLVGLFDAVAKLGLESIVIRNLVKEEKSSNEILGTSFILKLVSSSIAFAAVILLSLQIDGYSKQTILTSIVSFSLLCGSSDVIDYWLQSQVKSRSMSILLSVQILIHSILKVFCIVLKLPVVFFAGLYLLDFIVKLIGSIWIYFNSQKSIFSWRFDRERAIDMLKDSWPLILSSIMITIYMKVDRVMLEKISSSQEVGYYTAATRFSEAWYFIPLAICSSVFPNIIKTKQENVKSYYEKLQKLYDLLAFVSIGIGVIMTFLSKTIVVTLLGDEYVNSSTILILHIWSSPFVFLAVANHQWLVAENLTKFSFATTSLGAITNVILNFWLIPLYGGVGAALATVVSYAVSSHLGCIFYPPMYRSAWMLTKALFIPFRIRDCIKFFKFLLETIKGKI